MRLRRLISLPVLVTTAAAAVMVLVGAYLFILSGMTGSQTQEKLSESRRVGQAILAEVGRQAAPSQLSTFAPFLRGEDINAVLVRGGTRTTFGAQFAPGQQTVRVVVRRPGTVLLLHSAVGQVPGPFELLAVATAVLVIVLGVAFTTTAVTGRQTRRRVDAAVQAAERVAGGDFSARVGLEGPEALARLGAAFDDMAARLEAVDADQRRLVADLAHEIATPVNMLSGYAVAVLDGTLTPEAAEPVIAAQRARLADLLDELAQLRGLDSPADSEPAPVDLLQVARDSAADFATLAAERRIELTARGSPVVVTTNRRLVETVLRNLLSNAVRYTPEGGRVRVEAGARGHDAVVAVRDSGPGIAPDHQSRVFDRFYRTDAARDRASGGSGLGLAIAKRAAAAASVGGRLELDSSLGEGSEFRLVLPAVLGASRDAAVTTVGADGR